MPTSLPNESYTLLKLLKTPRTHQKCSYKFKLSQLQQQNQPPNTKTRNARFFSCSVRLASRPSPYEILGLKPGATKKEIKKRYYELCKIHHPDMQMAGHKAGATSAPNKKSSSEESATAPKLATKKATAETAASAMGSEKFKDIQHAYEFLSKAGNLPTQSIDFDNFRYSNRASYYQDYYSRLNEYYKQRNASSRAETGGRYSGSGLNGHGFPEPRRYTAKEREELNKDNYVVGALLSCFSAFALVGFGYYLFSNAARVETSIKQHHREASEMLSRARMRARGVNFYSAGPGHNLSSSSPSPSYSLSAPLSVSESELKLKQAQLEDGGLSHLPPNFTDPNHQLFFEYQGSSYFVSSQDEREMKMLATLDTKSINERISFPYGKSIEYSKKNDFVPY